MNEIAPSAPSTSEPAASLADMSAAELNAALEDLTAQAYANIDSERTRSWSEPILEVEGIACALAVDLSARCESLDAPGGPRGWRYKFEWSSSARLTALEHGAEFASTACGSEIRSDPRALAGSPPGSSLVNQAMDNALSRLRHHQAFASWREAAALAAATQPAEDAPPAADSGSRSKRL